MSRPFLFAIVSAGPARQPKTAEPAVGRARVGVIIRAHGDSADATIERVLRESGSNGRSIENGRGADAMPTVLEVVKVI